MKFRVTVGGCRDYSDYVFFCRNMDICLSRISSQKEIVIISGHSSGVDSMAERYAEDNGFELEIYPAEWKKYGRAAGPKRNKIMVERSDAVIAFWDNSSSGTKNLINCAEKCGKPVMIIDISKTKQV